MIRMMRIGNILVGVPNPLALPQASEAGNMSSNIRKMEVELWSLSEQYIKTPVIFLLTS